MPSISVLFNPEDIGAYVDMKIILVSDQKIRLKKCHMAATFNLCKLEIVPQL